MGNYGINWKTTLFFTKKQAHGECITQYATVLQNLSITCDFGILREELIKDIFICGLSQTFQKFKERLLSESEITWEKALQIAKSIEAPKDNATAIEHLSQNNISCIGGIKSYVSNSSKDRINGKHIQNKSNYQQGKCNKCGQNHRNKCPAEGLKCHVCGKLNHFAKMCFSKHQKSGKINRNRYVKTVVNGT